MTGGGQIINIAREPLSQRLLELTDGRGPDVVIEAVGTPGTCRAAVEEVAFTGRVVYIGYAKEPVAYETRLFLQKELDIMGSRNALPEDFHQVIRMLEERRFPVDEAAFLQHPNNLVKVFRKGIPRSHDVQFFLQEQPGFVGN